LPTLWRQLHDLQRQTGKRTHFSGARKALQFTSPVLSCVALTTLGLGGGDATPRQSRMRSVLVAAQVALSIGLLATAWQLVATIRVFGQSMRLAGIGLIVGTAASVAVSRWIQSEYHGITGIDPLAVAASVGLSPVAMLLGSGIPAARASHLDPVQQLKDH
jgi:hypothetical protein